MSLFVAAGKIQVSAETKMLLDMEGGFMFTERGCIEIKASYLDNKVGQHRPNIYNRMSGLYHELIIGRERAFYRHTG